MVTLLITVIVLSLGISFLCSLMEAALLTAPLSYAQSMADQGKRMGKLLLNFKRDVSSPISAILILNTISHTVGAAVSGALVDKIYGEQMLLWFSLIFTLLILYFSEIIPKQLGAVFYRSASLLISQPLAWMIRMFYPMIVTTNWVSNLIKNVSNDASVSVQEILSLAKIGGREGVLDTLESSVIRNIILLDRVSVSKVLTPRPVVFVLSEDTCLKDIKDSVLEWNQTRIPLHEKENPDVVKGYIHQRDVFRSMLQGEEELRVSELMRPIKIVPETTSLDKLFVTMIETRDPIYAVVDEYGVFKGLVTMEDIIEEIVGKEIVDEYDIVSDLQAYAKALYHQKKKQGYY